MLKRLIKIQLKVEKISECNGEVFFQLYARGSIIGIPVSKWNSYLLPFTSFDSAYHAARFNGVKSVSLKFKVVLD